VGQAVREPTSTGNGVTEMGRHSSSSPPSPSRALKRIGHLFPAGWTERFIEKSLLKLCFEPRTFGASDQRSNHSATAPHRLTFSFYSDTMFLYSLVVLLLIPSLASAASLQKANKRRHKGADKLYDSFFSQLPLQPSPALIPLDIEESPNRDLDPDIETLDEYGLLMQMGEDYDRQFMSIRQPLDMRRYPNGTLFYRFTKDMTPSDDKMPAEIEMLSKKSIKLTPEGPELKVRFNRRTKNKLQKFLWAYSYCPVRYKWKEMSIRYWPRWIKTGTCDNQRSCSIPAGMGCAPSKMRNIKLLRYYCPIVGARKSCTWIKIEYPILEKCSCSCPYSQIDSQYLT